MTLYTLSLSCHSPYLQRKLKRCQSSGCKDAMKKPLLSLDNNAGEHHDGMPGNKVRRTFAAFFRGTSIIQLNPAIIRKGKMARSSEMRTISVQVSKRLLAPMH